jgi:hypothetical protein
MEIYLREFFALHVHVLHVDILPRSRLPFVNRSPGDRRGRFIDVELILVVMKN